MSLNSSMLSVSNRSSFAESVLEASGPNKNVSFSKLDISEIVSDENTIQNTQAVPQGVSHCNNGHNNNSAMGIKISNGVRNTTKCPSSLKNSYCSTTNETTIVTEVVIDEVEEEKADESIIPVDEDDEVEEVSTIENCEQTHDKSIQKEMFSHLQPNEIMIEKEVVQETVEDQDMTESFAEEDSSQFLQDENDFFQYPFIELGRRLWPSAASKQMYTKGCLWSPDGTCILVPVHLDGMHIVELPTDLYTIKELNIERNLSNLTSAVHVKEGGTVYDCCWYPYMNSAEPTTCCWLATRQHEPVHMWDAFSGELRCSYRGYDDVDEVESAISIIFSNDGQKVIGGYKKAIKVFDTDIPGRDCNVIPVKNAISCFALTSENDNCITAGTWAGYINHYDLRAPKLGPLFTLGGHNGGITWLKYSPTQDHNWYLFSGARKDNKIIQWDMRNYKEPLQIFERNVETNQRIYYDLTPLNTWLASGDTKGLLKIWNLSDKDTHFELPIHQDCCNGVSFHPTLPIISTTSGQYHFTDVSEMDECMEKIIDYENSLLFLWYGPSK